METRLLLIAKDYGFELSCEIENKLKIELLRLAGKGNTETCFSIWKGDLSELEKIELQNAELLDYKNRNKDEINWIRIPKIVKYKYPTEYLNSVINDWMITQGENPLTEEKFFGGNCPYCSLKTHDFLRKIYNICYYKPQVNLNEFKFCPCEKELKINLNDYLSHPLFTKLVIDFEGMFPGPDEKSRNLFFNLVNACEEIIPTSLTRYVDHMF